MDAPTPPGAMLPPASAERTEAMRINADFSRRVVVRPGDADWTPSPMPGVERRMLDRIGGEVARATSLVRYAPGSRFSAHTHGGGEEFLVLEGVFSDGSGDFPAGHYVRNPIGSAHAPHTIPGCTIFVKLHQFDPADTAHVVTDTRAAAFAPGPAPGVATLALHAFGEERVAMLRLDPGAVLPARPVPGGEEVLLLEGSLAEAGETHRAGTWIRTPDGGTVPPRAAGPAGCLLFVKTGHLTEAALSRFSAVEA